MTSLTTLIEESIRKFVANIGEKAYMPAAQIAIVALYAAARKYNKVIEIYQQKPGAFRTAQAYVALGFSYFNLRQYRLACKYYEIAAELYSESPRIYHYLGDAHRAQGMHDQALQAYQEALNLDPTDASAYNSLGIVYASKGLLLTAASYFERALELAPHLWIIEDNLRMVNIELDKHKT